MLRKLRDALLWPLLRVGLVSRRHDGKIRWPVSFRARWSWFLLWRGDEVFERVGVFRNLPHVVKWQRGRFLPWRWGFFILGLEIGDRGSHHGPQDLGRLSLFRRRVTNQTTRRDQ